MLSLAVLLKKFEEATRENVRTETRLADLQRQILAVPARQRLHARRPRKKRGIVASGIPDSVRTVLQAIRDAGEPLGRVELGRRLGITPGAAAKRLERALELQFIEQASYGLYRCTDAVSAAL